MFVCFMCVHTLFVTYQTSDSFFSRVNLQVCDGGLSHGKYLHA